MGDKKPVFWLKCAFMVGVITDALALIPMLCPPMAKFFWGFDGFTGIYYFAMGYGATFMLAWTLLLYWAFRRPLERSHVALLTILVLVGFMVTETVSIREGYILASKALPSLILQAAWLILFGYAFMISRSARSSANGNGEGKYIVSPLGKKLVG